MINKILEDWYEEEKKARKAVSGSKKPQDEKETPAKRLPKANDEEPKKRSAQAQSQSETGARGAAAPVFPVPKPVFQDIRQPAYNPQLNVAKPAPIPFIPQTDQLRITTLPYYHKDGQPRATLFTYDSNTVPLPEPGPPPTPDPAPVYVSKPAIPESESEATGFGMVDPALAQAQLEYKRRIARGFADPALAQAQQIYKDDWMAALEREKDATVFVDPGLADAERAYDKMLSRGFADPALAEAIKLDSKNQYGVKVDALLRIAKSQLNTKEGPNNDNPYGIWYGNPNDEWCAQFASWCASQVGSLNTNPDNSNLGVPKNQSTSRFIADYKKMNRYAYGYHYTSKENVYKPKAGDFIFFSWGHTGIVVAFDEITNTVYTIEGNAGAKSNGVYYNTRELTDSRISGYGINGGASYGTIPDLGLNWD